MPIEKMTLDKLIEICEAEYKQGMVSAKTSAFDFGCATAFKNCLEYAKQIKSNCN